MNYSLIDQNDQLAAVCDKARQHSAVALDTEFVRTRTYYPQLGLIQLFDGEQLVLIDPLNISDWSPFIALLRDTQVTKFLHAGGEDLEVFLHRFRCLPDPMVDTQILAAFAGQPLSWGFAAMVMHFNQIELDKSEARTDWLARPLTARQCEYAAADVAYLLPIAHQLVAQTEAAGNMAAALSECDTLCQRRLDVLVPEDAWRDITNAWQLRPRQLAALQRLAAWRLNIARQKDMAVNFVVREENLWKVARFMPGSLGELDHLGLNGHEIRFHGKALVAMVAEAQAQDESTLPQPLGNLIDHPEYKQTFKAIKALVQQVSEETGFSQELLASRRQINQVLSVHWGLKNASRTPELIAGWRGDLFKARIDEILQTH
ncbi:ribonuclease D [Pantoea phytobeneficialis]|uniref:Ribonuclease D n=1 Tax=Pantoea phytobeneficialis TaxID=2052056 RepID=A0AAP9KR54_9GAMM|nr:ribonuclease D [Pantoea phytobeneficialis]MDO6405381.1 ribonuclease D [Pantoea phytobeneficialis]QGR08729.1 ribonuclease D [Pantoea phytobeneficialis]